RDGLGFRGQAAKQGLSLPLVHPLPPHGARTMFEMGQVIVFHEPLDHGQVGGSPVPQKLAQAEKEILQLMTDAHPPPLLPVIPEGLEKVEGRLKLVSGQKFDRLVEVMGVPVLFQNVLGPLDADHVVKGEHLAGKHFVGGAVDVDIAVFFRLAPQTRAAEKLQKAQLQLLRFQGEHVVERLFEGSVILLRQSGDQVQMLDDLPALPQGAHGAGQFFKVLPPLDQFVGEGIGRLNADLEAEKARRRVFVQKTDDLRPKDIGGDLKLKHASAMVVDQKAEQLQGEGAVNVEGAVDELDRFGRDSSQVEDGFLDRFSS